uniref:DNA helicase n=1 Tax=Parastrongyloides trichosuri TaxID=131310 RepID=A0A0N4Z8I6_PARTI
MGDRRPKGMRRWDAPVETRRAVARRPQSGLWILVAADLERDAGGFGRALNRAGANAKRRIGPSPEIGPLKARRLHHAERTTVAAVGIVPRGAVAIAPGAVLGLADHEVQRAGFAQRQRHGGRIVLIAARAHADAELAVHLARLAFGPGVDRGVAGGFRRAFADPASDLLISGQPMRSGALHGGAGRAVSRGGGKGGSRRRQHSLFATRRGRDHALGVHVRQQHRGGGHRNCGPKTTIGSSGPIAAPQRIRQGLAFGRKAERHRVDAVAQTGRRRAVGEHMAQMAAAAGAADLGADHAVAGVADLAHVRLVERREEAGPAGAALELAEDPGPLLAQQGPAEGRLGAVGQKDALLLGRQIGLQRHTLALARRRQIKARGRTQRRGGFGLGHAPKIGRAGRCFHRPAPLVQIASTGLAAFIGPQVARSAVGPLKETTDPGAHGGFVGRVAGVGQALRRDVALVVGALTRGPGLVAIAEVRIVRRQTLHGRLDEDRVHGGRRTGQLHVRQTGQQVQGVQAAVGAAAVDQNHDLALHRIGGAGVGDRRTARHDEGLLTSGQRRVKGGDDGLGLFDHSARFLHEARIGLHAAQGVGEPLTVGRGGAIGDLASFRLAADGELGRPDAVGQAIAARGGVGGVTLGAAQVDDQALSAAQGAELAFDLGEEGVPAGIVFQRVDVNPRTTVNLLDRQLGRAGREDGGAVGGFQVGGGRRLRAQRVVAGATTDLELAGRGHAPGHGVVAVPQQIGGGADAACLGGQVAFEPIQLGLGEVRDRLDVAGLDHGADRRRVAHARLDVGDDILTVAPGRGHAGPAGGEEGAGAFERRRRGDVRVAEAVGVVAQQVGVALAAVDLTGLGHGVRQTGVDPAAEGFAGGARDHGGGVVGLQGVVRGLKILARQVAEVLGRGAASREGQSENSRRSGEQTLVERPDPAGLRHGLAAPSSASGLGRRRRAHPRCRRFGPAAGAEGVQPLRRVTEDSERRFGRLNRAEDPLEGCLQGPVRLIHRRQDAEVDQAGDTVLGDAAGHDAAEMIQVGLHVQADAVEADPFADFHADGGDLVLTAPARALAFDPDADAPLTHPRLDAELIQSADDPVFQAMHEGAHVLAAPVQVEHDISHALAGTMIGELPAPPYRSRRSRDFGRAGPFGPADATAAAHGSRRPRRGLCPDGVLRRKGRGRRRRWRRHAPARPAGRPAPRRRRRPDGLPDVRAPRRGGAVAAAGPAGRHPARTGRRHPRGSAGAGASPDPGRSSAGAGLRRRRRRGRRPGGRPAREGAGRHARGRSRRDRKLAGLSRGFRRPPDAARGHGRAAVLDRRPDHRPRPPSGRGPARAVLRRLCGRSGEPPGRRCGRQPPAARAARDAAGPADGAGDGNPGRDGPGRGRLHLRQVPPDLGPGGGARRTAGREPRGHPASGGCLGRRPVFGRAGDRARPRALAGHQPVHRRPRRRGHRLLRGVDREAGGAGCADAHRGRYRGQRRHPGPDRHRARPGDARADLVQRRAHLLARDDGGPGQWSGAVAPDRSGGGLLVPRLAHRGGHQRGHGPEPAGRGHCRGSDASDPVQAEVRPRRLLGGVRDGDHRLLRLPDLPRPGDHRPALRASCSDPTRFGTRLAASPCGRARPFRIGSVRVRNYLPASEGVPRGPASDQELRGLPPPDRASSRRRVDHRLWPRQIRPPRRDHHRGRSRTAAAIRPAAHRRGHQQPRLDPAEPASVRRPGQLHLLVERRRPGPRRRGPERLARPGSARHRRPLSPALGRARPVRRRPRPARPAGPAADRPGPGARFAQRISRRGRDARHGSGPAPREAQPRPRAERHRRRHLHRRHRPAGLPRRRRRLPSRSGVATGDRRHGPDRRGSGRHRPDLHRHSRLEPDAPAEQ